MNTYARHSQPRSRSRVRSSRARHNYRTTFSNRPRAMTSPFQGTPVVEITAPRRTTLHPVIAAAVYDQNLQDLEDHGRQDIIDPLENSQHLEKCIKEFMKHLYIIQAFLISVFFLLFMLTQVQKGSFQAALLTFEILNAVYLVMMIRGHCLTINFAQRREYTSAMIEAAFYLAFLVSFARSTYQGGSVGLFIGITCCLLLIQAAKALYIYYEMKFVPFKFVKYTGTIITLIRGFTIVQVIMILMKCNNTISFSWTLVFTPLFLIAWTIFTYFLRMLRYSLNPVGILLWKPFARPKFMGTIWVMAGPVVFAGLIAWFAIAVSIYLNNPGSYSAQNWLFSTLFAGIFGFNLVSIIYNQVYENQILSVLKYLANIFDLDFTNTDRIQILSDKLKEEQKKLQEDNYIPKVLVKVSHTYFSVPDKAQAKIGDILLKTSGDDINCIVKNKYYEDDQRQGSEQLDISNKIVQDGNLIKGDYNLNQFTDLEKEEGGHCIICFDQKPDAVYLPCGHGGVCYGCSQEVLKVKGYCHFCRKEVRRLAKVETLPNSNEFVKVLTIVKTQK